MTKPAADPEAYMEAFMNGFEFVLLAIRGRLAEGTLAPKDRARLEVFLADYSKIAQAYRERRAAPTTDPTLAITGRMSSSLEPVATN